MYRRYLSLLCVLATAHCVAAVKERAFEFTGTYQWGEKNEINEPNFFTRAGRLTGTWQCKFKDGQSGRATLSSVTVFRLKPFAVTGTLEVDLGSIDGSLAGRDLVYVAFDGVPGPGAESRTTLEGRVLGGKGRYAGVTGSMKWVAANGLVEKGTGVLKVSDGK